MLEFSKKMFRLVTWLVIALLISGCGPRGESKTVDEVFYLAQERFNRALENSALEDSRRQILKNIKALVQDFVTSDSSQVLAILIAEELKKITHFCHPNTRTSIFEQIETIETLKSVQTVQPNLRFYLGARVLNILASELETHQLSYTFSG